MNLKWVKYVLISGLCVAFFQPLYAQDVEYSLILASKDEKNLSQSLSFYEKLIFLHKISEISVSEKEKKPQILIEAISPTLLKFSLVKDKSTEDKGYLELELLPPLSELDSLRRDKLLEEEIEKLELLEEPVSPEMRNYTWKDRLYGGVGILDHSGRKSCSGS